MIPHSYYHCDRASAGVASEVAVWACGVAAAARAAATAPGLRLFVLGALGGVAGV